MRFSVHRPAQGAATHWGWYTPTPNALIIVQFKQKFSDFHTLTQRYAIEKCIQASTKARQHAFQRVAQPSVWQQAKTINLWVFLGSNSHSPQEVEGPGAPPPSLAPHALIGPWHSSSHSGFLPLSITYKANNGGGTSTRTSGGTPLGCGFHPSIIDK